MEKKQSNFEHIISTTCFQSKDKKLQTNTKSRLPWWLRGNKVNAGVAGLIPGLGRSPGEGNWNPLQYSCLGDPMDRGAWQTTVQCYRVGRDLATEHTCNTHSRKKVCFLQG